MIEVYGIKNCNKIRDTRAWLKAKGVDYTFIDVKTNPLSEEKLDEFVHKLGLDRLVNRRGMKWRQLGLAGKNLSDQELFKQLLEHQTMIKRPLLVRDKGVMVGYDEDAFEKFVA
ncbi:MAG: arsenate reductase family protein [Balneolaceae bacterium]